MKINIHENTLVIKEEDGTVIRTSQTETFIIYPAEGKRLKNKITGYITSSYVGVSSRAEIANYEEID